jgi:hypothetical protein
MSLTGLPSTNLREKGVKEMMVKLERLGRRLLPHPDEGGEQSKPAKGLRWYHKAFVVPALAFAIVAGGLAFPNQAEAHHTGGWYQQNWSNVCFWSQDHYTGNYVQRGCGYWGADGVFYYRSLEYGQCWYLTTANGNDWYGWFKDPFCG